MSELILKYNNNTDEDTNITWMFDPVRLSSLVNKDPNDCHLFIPWYCWYDNDQYSDFFPSRLQVSMCHDFDPYDSRIIEVDIRIAWCIADTTHFGVMDEDGKSIWHLYRDPRALVVCGPKERWVPCCITDMRKLDLPKLIHIN